MGEPADIVAELSDVAGELLVYRMPAHVIVAAVLRSLSEQGLVIVDAQWVGRGLASDYNPALIAEAERVAVARSTGEEKRDG